MRCASCNLFVPVEMGEPETDSVELEASGDGARLTGNVRLVKLCENCGDELAEANPDVDVEVEFAHAKEDCEGDLVLDEVTADSTDTGGGRYEKRYYGADCTATVRCEDCGAVAEIPFHVDEAASYFDEI